ncbi:hypothetical protein [Paraglaciecola polaris]|uniref:Uncharacterized protein n=1 Tax=Paraglaciecola polaris LMG 21857 TaxID=1129793 RepID=K6ZU94_9ALTE|nr:hypothetical protein [Paraglaciecola polaris]GAC32378.1 hypothetical protein GPLA_1464 [Paraglaciecola polaris LMG 21857]
MNIRAKRLVFDKKVFIYQAERFIVIKDLSFKLLLPKGYSDDRKAFSRQKR